MKLMTCGIDNICPRYSGGYKEKLRMEEGYFLNIMLSLKEIA